MFSPILINTPFSFIPSRELIETIFTAVSAGIEIPQHGTINIAFLEDEAIRELNLTYRGIDKTTDVLSFHYFDDFSNLSATEVVGEIILSESRIIEQAREYGNTLEAEFAKLLIHSALHILGYDHEEDEEYQVMREQEQKIEKILLEKIGMRIY